MLLSLDAVIKEGSLAVWCSAECVDVDVKVHEVRQQLKEIMEQQKMDIISCGAEWDVIRKCICSSYFQQAARLKVTASCVSI